MPDLSVNSPARFQFSLRAVFLYTFAVALCLGLVIAAPRLGIEWTRSGVAGTLIAGGLIFWSTTRQWRYSSQHKLSVWGALGHVALCVYLPFSWLLFIEYSWSSYHMTWLTMWPYLPGLFVGMLFHPDSIEFLIMAIATALMIAALTWLTCRGRYGLLAATVIALAVEIPSGLLSYALFRA